MTDFFTSAVDQMLYCFSCIIQIIKIYRINAKRSQVTFETDKRNPFIMVFGEVDAEITSKATFKDGVDMIDSIIMTFPDGKVATLQSNVYAVQNRNASIFGTKGYIEITNINNPEEIKVFDADYKEVRAIKVPEQISGYEYEVQACARAIRSKAVECPEMLHAETVKVLEILDGIRKDWGYEIPEA